MAKRTDRQDNSTDSHSVFYILLIRFMNRLVWGIYRDLTNQDGKSQSLSCHNVLHL